MGCWIEYVCTKCGNPSEAKLDEQPHACIECGTAKYMKEVQVRLQDEL